MSNDIVLCGVGGQGTVLASKLLATAAMQRGLDVKTAETIGMAQRGGSVFSHVRIGEEAASPLIGRGRADLLVAFEPAEAVRQLPFLREGGTAIVATRPVVPASALTGGPAYDLKAIRTYLEQSVGHLVLVDAEAAARELGTAKVLNVVLLGAAAGSGALAFSRDDLVQAIRARVKERFWELNARALDFGVAVGSMR